MLAAVPEELEKSDGITERTMRHQNPKYLTESGNSQIHLRRRNYQTLCNIAFLFSIFSLIVIAWVLRSKIFKLEEDLNISNQMIQELKHAIPSLVRNEVIKALGGNKTETNMTNEEPVEIFSTLTDKLNNMSASLDNNTSILEKQIEMDENQLSKMNSLSASLGKEISDIKQTTNELIPKGTIIAYNYSECPEGWEEVLDTKGRTIVGSGTIEGREFSHGSTGGNVTHTLTISEMPKHQHKTPVAKNSGIYKQTLDGYETTHYTFMGVKANEVFSIYPMCFSTRIGGNRAHNNMQPYVTKTYCMKS